MLLIDEQPFVVALVGAVELLLKFVLSDNCQQPLGIHTVYVRADILNV